MQQLALFDSDNTSIGWQAPADLSAGEWREFGRTIGKADAALNWIVGDWLLAHRGEWGEMYTEAEELTGWNYQKLKHCKLVSDCFNLVDRSTKLSWTHHYRIAASASDNALDYLRRAEADGLSVRGTIAMIEADKAPAPPPPQPLPALTATVENIQRRTYELSVNLREIARIAAGAKREVDAETFNGWIAHEFGWSPLFGRWVLWLADYVGSIEYEWVERFYFGKSRDVSIGNLVTEHDYRTRSAPANNPQHVIKLIECIRSGDALPPLLAYDVDGDLYLSDGFLRLEAYRLAGVNTVCVKIEPGDTLDVLGGASRANARHSMPLSENDVRRNVINALRHPYAVDLTDEQIAKHCGASIATVKKMRRQR